MGVAEHVGDALTYKVLEDDTLKIIYRSTIRSAETGSGRNLRLDQLEGEDPQAKPIVTSVSDYVNSSKYKAASFSPDELLGMRYFTD
jgi:hypothetical protein